MRAYPSQSLLDFARSMSALRGRSTVVMPWQSGFGDPNAPIPGKLERNRATHDWTTGRDQGNHCTVCGHHEDSNEADLPCAGPDWEVW